MIAFPAATPAIDVSFHAPEATWKFPSGDLTVRVDDARWPLRELCDFAVRENPKRAYLIVSKVLGRHIACRPSTMRATFKDLASQLPPDLPGPVLVVAMAEMGVCLGAGVHEEYRKATGRDDLVFLHSTRHRLDAPVLAHFLEPHSHAPEHTIYTPEDEAVGRLVTSARSLVLVDDEASTGATFVNVALALTARLPGLERICTAVLTDWSGGRYLGRMPRRTQTMSLLTGHLDWAARRGRPAGGLAAAAPSIASLKTLDAPNFGRRGFVERPGLPPADLPALTGEAVLVLGSGEFTYAPFLLAEELERQGIDVRMQATSRSPVRLGGAIRTITRLQDNYGEGVQHFLYNLRPSQQLILCCETPAAWVDGEFVRYTGASVVSFG